MIRMRNLSWFFLAAALLSPIMAQTEVERLSRYEFGRSRVAWNILEAQLRNPLQREREAGERTLISVLTSRASTTDARILACRGLRYVGGTKGIQNLLALIRDPRLSQEACMALQEKESADINPMLREALPLVENALKSQLMVTLGRRRDVEAVPVIATITKSLGDKTIQGNAIHALGQIGGREALSALSGLKVDASHNRLRSLALLAAAARGLEGDVEDIKAGLVMLRRLSVNPALGSVRLAALYEWAKHDRQQRVALCRQSLSSRGNALLEIAPKLFVLLDRDAKRDLYGNFFDDLSVSAKTLLVDLWEQEFRNVDKLRGISIDISGDAGLREASLRALDRIHE